MEKGRKEEVGPHARGRGRRKPEEQGTRPLKNSKQPRTVGHSASYGDFRGFLYEALVFYGVKDLMDFTIDFEV